MGKLPPDEMLRPRGLTPTGKPDTPGSDNVTISSIDTAHKRICPDPVGISEIAERHGTTPGTIRSWRHRHPDFPLPIAELAMGPLFDWREVETWLRTRR